MNAIGIDVSKGKSMVSILRPLGVTVAQPFEVAPRSSCAKQADRLYRRLGR